MEEEAKKALYKIFAQDDEIEIVDEKGDGRHFYIQIVSEKFKNKSLVERSRMVYRALNDLLKKDHMHAVRLKLKTPKEC